MTDADNAVAAGLREITAAYGDAGQPDATFLAFDRVVERGVGRVFFTVLKVEEEVWSRRIFTTVPDDYPVAGRKPLPRNPRTHEIYNERKPFFAQGRERIEGEYPGHAIVLALGADNLANIPIAFDGRVIGAANIGGRGWRDHDAIGRFLLPLAQALAPAVAMRG